MIEAATVTPNPFLCATIAVGRGDLLSLSIAEPRDFERIFQPEGAYN